MEKTKQKGNPQKANRRFALVLLGFIVFALVISIYTVATNPYIYISSFVALQPPFTHLTPILYLIISLAWIPFAVKHRRIYGFSKWHWVLIAVCIVSIALMTGLLYLTFSSNSDGGGWCYPDFEPIPFTPFAIFNGWKCYWVGPLF